MKKQTFNIPEGCKTVTMEQIDNRIITTFEAEEKAEEKYIPKVGDCVKLKVYEDGTAFFCCISSNGIRVNGSPYIFNNGIFNDATLGGGWRVNDSNLSFSEITPEELQAEFNKLGYEYDFETNTAKKLRWKPNTGEIYYYVGNHGRILECIFYNNMLDNQRRDFKNFFKTEKEAEKFRDYIKKYNPDEE